MLFKNEFLINLETVRRQETAFSRLAQSSNTLDGMRAIYETLMALRPEERVVWQWIGAFDVAFLSHPNVLIATSPETLTALSQCVGEPVGLWPEVPPEEQTVLGFEGSFYDAGLDVQFSAWANLRNQQVLRNYRSLNGLGLSLLCSAWSSESILRDIVPQHWYGSSIQAPGSCIQRSEILSVLALLCNHLGWVGFETFFDPHVWLLGFSEQRSERFSKLILSLEAANTEHVTFRITNEVLVVTWFPGQSDFLIGSDRGKWEGGISWDK